MSGSGCWLNLNLKFRAKRTGFKMKKLGCTMIFATLVTLQWTHSTDGAKILVQPMMHFMNSRFANMLKISGILLESGYDVTMLIPSTIVPKNPPKNLKFMIVPYRTEELVLAPDMLLREQRKSPLNFLIKMLKFTTDFYEHFIQQNQTLEAIREAKFDLHFFDAFAPETAFVSRIFGLPAVTYSNFGFDSDPFILYPINAAYIPSTFTGYSDHMTFFERLGNTFDFMIQGSVRAYTAHQLMKISQKHGFHNDKQDGILKSSVMIANVDFVFDYPRPIMPWIKPISGLLFHRAQPLPDDLENFMTSSGNHGVIVASFGSMMATFDEEQANAMATAFAKFPQKVIWRYDGKGLKAIGNNTKLLPWLPQNDLLGHPKTRLFVTHCGVSSSHEALYHGIPVIAVPLFFDQFHHAKKFTERLKMGVEVPYYELNADNLYNAMHNVLHNEEYHNNATKVSKLVRDQPMAGRDTLLFWVDYTIRNKGPQFLHPQAVDKLSWYQYFLLDVAVFMLACIALVVYVIYILIKLTIKVIKWFYKGAASNSKKNGKLKLN